MNKLAIKYAFKELRARRGFAIMYILNLSLGLFGFVLLDGFKSSFEQSLQERSKNLMAADIRISARRLIEPEKRAGLAKILPPGSEFTEYKTVYGMIRTESQSKLVEINAFAPNYPFYGFFQLSGTEKPIRQAGETALFNESFKIWIDPDLGTQIQVDVGDEVKIGDLSLGVSDRVLDSSTASWAGVALAPRVYMSLESLDSTGLIQPGSTVWHSTLIKLPPGADEKVILEQVDSFLDDPDLRLDSHSSAADNSSTALRYLMDFLFLIALAGLLLSAIATLYLFFHFSSSSRKNMTIFTTLGLTPRTAFQIGLWQILFLALASATLASLLAIFAFIPLKGSLAALNTDVANVAIAPSTFASAYAISILTSLLAVFPILWLQGRTRPGTLLSEDSDPIVITRNAAIAWTLIVGVVFFFTAVWQANSLVNGGLFTLGLLATIILVGLVGGLTVRIIKNFRYPFSLKIAAQSMSKRWQASLATFMALGVGSSLINVIPQLEASLKSQLEFPDQGKVPQFFLVDIQKPQIDTLKETAAKYDAEIQNIAPMIRARLLKINGDEVEVARAQTGMTREEARRNRMRNRGYNLTYEDDQSNADIVEGDPITTTYEGDLSGTPLISVEQRFADRLNLDLGDVLTFDVLGLELSAKIANFRRIKWTTFQPNFFVTFQGGFLDAAPKTFISTIRGLTEENLVPFQRELIGKEPNISIIDIRKVVEKILSMLGTTSKILTSMALLALVVGFIVLYSIILHQSKTRAREIALLKSLGTPVETIRRSLIIEFGTTGFVAGCAGMLVSVVISYTLSSLLFDEIWSFSLATPLFLWAILTFLAVFVTWLGTRKALAIKPASLLEEH